MKEHGTSTLFRGILIALLSLAIFADSPQAFAQWQPGESGNFAKENVGITIHNDDLRPSPPQDLITPSSYSEARNGSALLRVWRGDSDNQVWMSWGIGRGPFTLGTTATYNAPAVIPYKTDQFMVFHTGVDGGIYYTILNASATSGTSWQEIPDQTTNASVSATQWDSQGDVYLVYQGSNGDRRVYDTWLDSNGWHFGGNIGGGDALSNQLWVAAQGTDYSIWTTHQQVGASGWPGWSSLGQYTFTTPEIVATSDGTIMISYSGASDGGRPHNGRFDQNLNPIQAWTLDPTGFQTNNPIVLTTVGDTVFALSTGQDQRGYWQQLYTP